MSKETQEQFKKIEDWLNTEYQQIHSGRATPMVLDSVQVELYEMMQPIRNIASISIEDPKTIRIAPWDKNAVKAIEKSLTDSNLGLGVVADSDGIRLIFPALTTERRQQTVKILGQVHEEARIRVRKIRGDVMDSLKDLPEDEQRNTKDEIQKLVDNTNANLESISKKKEQEVMGNE